MVFFLMHAAQTKASHKYIDNALHQLTELEKLYYRVSVRVVIVAMFPSGSYVSRNGRL